jgi:antitoxin (DNA-binding transcriptional repressor) of toxin-antitoxin stability system
VREGNFSANARLLAIDEVASGSYFGEMRSVGLKVLKNKLSEYVRLAARGETVLVTDRDRVVAEIGPPQQRRKKLSDEGLIALGAREGWLTPAANPNKGPLPRKPVMKFEDLMRELDQDREDRDLPR